jgi:putative ABC transport system permease protein
MNDFVLVRKNLFRKKLRAVLMIVSILTAFAIFGVLASFERAFNAGQEVAEADRLVVVNKITRIRRTFSSSWRSIRRPT